MARTNTIATWRCRNNFLVVGPDAANLPCRRAVQRWSITGEEGRYRGAKEALGPPRIFPATSDGDSNDGQNCKQGDE
jgi:hypothetical protein